jgi:phosphatidylglycerophosphatase A
MSRWIATWFLLGYMPRAPGTWGSIGAIPFALLIDWIGGPYLLFVAAALLFLIGERTITAWLGGEPTTDRQEIVVDEVVGVWFTLSAADSEPLLYVAGFVLFRIFDIWKPWPVSWADQNVPGAFGIMLDDVLAAGYAFACLLLLGEVLEA